MKENLDLDVPLKGKTKTKQNYRNTRQSIYRKLILVLTCLDSLSLTLMLYFCNWDWHIE